MAYPDHGKPPWYWTLADELRATGRRIDLPSILREARQRGYATSWRDISQLARIDQRAAELIDPTVVVEFFVALSREGPPRRVLDPWAGLGVTLSALDHEGLVIQGLGIEINRDVHELAIQLANSSRLEWRQGDAAVLLAEGIGEFDLVVGSPPVGLPKATLQWTDPAIELRASGTYTMLVQAALTLAPGGQMAVILPQSFFLPANQPVRDALGAGSVYVNAVFALPARALRIQIPMGVVVFGREAEERIFAAELDPSIDVNALLENYRSRREGPLPELGRVVPLASFTSWRALTRGEEIAQVARRAGLEAVPLADVCRDIRRPRPAGDPFDPDPNSVYLPKLGTSPAVTSLDEFVIKPHNYLQLVIDPGAADAGYLAGFFSSPIGRLVRDQLMSGTTIPQTSLGSLRSGVIYLPPSLEQQRTATSVDRTLRELQLETQALQRKLWDRPLTARRIISDLARLTQGDALEHWTESLPFPLASILWRYNAADDPESRCRYLVNFFEATTLFLVDLHWSALHADVDLVEGAGRQERTEAITYARGSIGIWADLLARLAKKTRGLVEHDPPLAIDLFRVVDASRLAAIASRPVVGALRDEGAAYRRNWIAHAAPVTSAEWERRLSLADATLSRLRENLGDAFDGWSLIRPGSGRSRNGVVNTSVEYVVGSRSLFRRGAVDLRELPEEAALYMLESDASLPLRLGPLLGFRRSPESVEDACYFYDRIDAAGVRWISYHYDPQPEFVEPDSETTELIRELESLG